MVSSFFFRLFLFLAAAKSFCNDVKRHGDEEDSDHRCGRRAAHDRGAHDLPRHRARARGEGKREHAQEEGEGRHQDRPETQPGPLEGGIGQGTLPCSCLVFANSTIRIAFFAARPMRTMRPIWA